MSNTHQGQAVAQYRKAKGWSQDDLAGALRVHTRTVQRMEEQEVIRDINRRRLLVGLLGIPAVILSLGAEQKAENQTEVTVNSDRMSFFEEEMTTRWELYHVGGTIRVSRGLEMWIGEIARLAKSTYGTPWHERALALLSMSYQLQSCASRDLMLYTQAHIAFKKALQVAEGLNDAELTAAAPAREGVTLIQENRPSGSGHHTVLHISRGHLPWRRRIRAWVSVRALALPRCKNCSNSLRSPAVRSIGYDVGIYFLVFMPILPY